MRRVKTYLRSSVSQELLNSCLILATYTEQVDKLKFVEIANQMNISSKMNISFPFKNRQIHSAAKGNQTSNQRCCSVKTQTG